MQISPPSLTINEANFEVPPGYVGVPGLTSLVNGPLGHFVLLEGPRVDFTEGSGAATKIVGVPSTCTAVHPNAALRVHGHRAALYTCADGPMTPDTPALYLGHELLTWKEHGLVVQVSFHGHSQVNVDLDLAVADATALVRPRRS
jgi:hypothetical protein